MTGSNDTARGLLAQVTGTDHCLLVVRHGRTLWNDEDRMSTRTDIPLNDPGRAQAQQVGVALTGAAFDFAWTSPLQRALEAASIALAGAESQHLLPILV
jgi:broad specificity phosphatase PhoE